MGTSLVCFPTLSSNLTFSVVRIFNALVWMVLPHEYFYLGVTFIWAFVSTIFTRFFLNLRDTASVPPQGLITTQQHQTLFAYDAAPKLPPIIPSIHVLEQEEQFHDDIRVREYDPSLRTVEPREQSRRQSFSSHSHTMLDEHFEMHQTRTGGNEPSMA